MRLFRNNLAEIGTPTASDVTSTSMTISGAVTFYKTGTWGVAYKKNSASSWTHKECDSQTISESLTSLTASTKYDIKLFVKFDNVYQYGAEISATTEAAAAS